MNIKEIPTCELVEKLAKREGQKKLKKTTLYYIFNIQKMVV